MAQRFTLTIIPTGGTVRKTTASSSDLIAPVAGETIVRTADVGGRNWDTTKADGECRKCAGHAKWGNAPAATGDRWQALMVLDDGTNVNACGIYKGKFYTFAAATGLTTNIDAASAVTFATAAPISLMQYGAYAVMGSIGVTPYKWKHGDANLTKLVTKAAATEYKFKYLVNFHNHLIGAYSDQTNGNIDIRWTDALPSFADLEFPSANQIYKPDHDIGITGIKMIANMQCLVYGRRSIHTLAYNPDAAPVFSMQSVASNVGTESNWSIVDTGRSHCFFDRSRGFIELAGGASWTVISDPILPIIETINKTYYSRIVGTLSIGTNEVVWAVPTGASTLPDTLLYYNLATKQWRTETRDVSAMHYADTQLPTSYTWTNLIAALALQGITEWPSTGSWMDWRSSEMFANMWFGNSTGYTYKISGTSMDGADYAAFRIEPILSLPDPTRHKRTQELHFGLAGAGDYSISAWWRTGDTEQECRNAEWTYLGTVQCSATSDNAIYFDQCGKYNQLNWGSSDSDDPWRVTSITIKGILQ